MPGRSCTWAGVKDSTGLPGLLRVSQVSGPLTLRAVSQGQWAPPPFLESQGQLGPLPFLGSHRVSRSPPPFSGSPRVSGLPPGHSWGLSGLVRALRLFTPKAILKFKEIQNTGQ